MPDYTFQPFSIHCQTLSQSDFEERYAFCCNAYIKDGLIYRSFGRSGGGGDLQNFLSVLRLDNNYAIGPADMRKTRFENQLLDVETVGVYKLKQ